MLRIKFPVSQESDIGVLDVNDSFLLTMLIKEHLSFR